jgi:hypothetical protein
MAITIGRIRIDGGQQTNAWTPWRYERAVLRVVRQIQSTKSGSIVLDALRRDTLVTPYPTDRARNADADVARWHAADRFRDGYRANDYLYSCRDGEPLEPRRFGTGRGIEAQVRFTPGQWIPGAAQYGGPTGPGGAVTRSSSTNWFTPCASPWAWATAVWSRADSTCTTIEASSMQYWWKTCTRPRRADRLAETTMGTSHFRTRSAITRSQSRS